MLKNSTMIARRLSGLFTGFLLVGLSLTGGSPMCAQQQSASASAAHSEADHQASRHTPASKDSKSDHTSGCGAPSDCCQLMGACASSPLAGESRERTPRVAIAQRIVTKAILQPATPALSVDTPPPKA